MRSFVQVVDCGSFALAAERLGISRAMVSKNVMALEAHLSAQLLHRTTRRIGLTEAGEQFQARCRQILADLAEAEASVATLSDEPRGLLRVNCALSFGLRHLAPVMGEYLRRYPGVAVEIDYGDRVVDLVEEGYDLAIRIGASLQPALVVRRLSTARMVVCASPAYLKRHGTPRVPADLAAHACLCYSYWSSGDDWVFESRDGERATIRVAGPLRGNNGDSLLAAALADCGILLEPTFIVGDALRSGQLRTMLEDWTSAPLGVFAVYPSRRHLSAKVRTFVDFVAQRCGGERPYWDGRLDVARGRTRDRNADGKK
jgi:DNA-binding transcriptional LysR family regulator